MTDLAWPLLALAGGGLVVRGALSRFVDHRPATLAGLIALAVSTVGCLVTGDAGGTGLVLILCGGTLFAVQIADRRRSGDGASAVGTPTLLGAILCGLGTGLLFLPAPSTNDGARDPILVLDPDLERRELRSDLELAVLEIDLVLEGDLSRRERSARELKQWERLEVLSRIRARAQSERDGLTEMIAGLDDPSRPLPPPEKVIEALAGIERLLGAVRYDR